MDRKGKTNGLETGLHVILGTALNARLMPEEEEIIDDSQIKAKNIYVVLVNAKDQLLVEEELMDISLMLHHLVIIIQKMHVNY